MHAASGLARGRTEGAPPSPPLAVLQASHNGCAGGLLLTHFELLWIKAGCHFSDAQLRVPLRQIERAGASLLKSPFGSRAELLVATRGYQAPMQPPTLLLRLSRLSLQRRRPQTPSHRRRTWMAFRPLLPPPRLSPPHLLSMVLCAWR